MDPQKPTYRYKCRWLIENRFQTQSAFLQTLVPAPQPWRIALLLQFAVRTFIVRLMSQGSEIRNREISHLTSMENPLPYGCGSSGHNICSFV